MRFNKNKKAWFLSVLLLQLLFAVAQTKIVVISPDRKIKVEFQVQKGEIFYNISYSKEQVLQNSKLGIVMEDADFSKGLQLVSMGETKLISDSYDLLTAKRFHNIYKANKRIIGLKNSKGSLMNMVFQLSNDGVVFRYEFPGRTDTPKLIAQEFTSFHFYNGTRAWLQPKTESQSGWEHTNPSYEAHYMMDIPTGTSSPGKNGWVYPAMFHYKNCWLLISESGVGKNYCGTSLQQLSPDNEYSIGFPQPAETSIGGIVNPASVLPWQTPWRIIAIGDLKTVAESTLGTDLAIPAKKIDMSFIRPGRASWSWIMLKDNSVVYDVQKKYIDFAADMHWEYCLIDADWDRRIGYEKVKELAAYAATKNVGLLLWYNSSGDWNTTKYSPKGKLLTHELREKEFEWLQQTGIKGIKVDFFAGDGQSMMSYYQDILEDAAAHKLLVNFHGATLPRGWQRTYPNMMTAEAIFGYEMITFEQKNADVAPQHMVMSAFARNAFDPMDFTPVNLYKIPKINRKTSSAFELALSVIFLSGIQHFAETPDGMNQINPQVKEFMKTVPVVWDDVKFIDGFPGKYYVVARRKGNKWYVAGINADSTSKKMNIDISFAGKKNATVFSDGTDMLSFNINKIDAIKNNTYEINIKPNGGFVMLFE